MLRQDVQPTEFIDRFGAVKKRFHAVAEATYARIDLGTMQAKLVRHIGRHSRISQAALARATASDPTLTSRTVAILIERGIVRRERSAADRREYMLELTAAGKRLRERIEKLRTELAARLVAALDDKDLADFDRVTAKILAALEPPAR